MVDGPDSTAKLQHRTAWISIAGALVSLLTVILGFRAQQLSSELDKVKQQASALSDTTSTQQARIEALQRENARLHTGPATSPPESTPPDSPTTTGTSSVRKAMGLVLNSRQGIDLDSSTADWGRADEGPDGADVFLTQYGGNQISISAKSATVVDGPPSVDTCRDPSRQTDTGRIDAANNVGRSFCYLTDERRRVWLTIRKFTRDPWSLTFDVLVWRIPED